MKRHHLIAATLVSAGLGLFATTALADCASELAALPGTSKDGAAAPMATDATPQVGGMAASGTDDAAHDAGKAGNLMPMGTAPDVATSAEDAQAQSQGGKTAAEQAMGQAGGADADREGLIAQARTAMASGDEEACMAALEKLKGM